MLSRYHLSRSGEQDRLGAAGNDADETEWILRVLLCLLVIVGNPSLPIYFSFGVICPDSKCTTVKGLAEEALKVGHVPKLKPGMLQPSSILPPP